LLFALSNEGYCQPEKKNTIKINISNPLLFGSKAYIFGYERIIGNNQSFSVNIGRMSLPAFLNKLGNDSVKLLNNTSERGFNFSVDYRFYLSKENKYNAPHGVYIGPYYSYNHFSRTNTWLVNTSTIQGNVGTTIALNINTVGAELGYQFVLWKKLAVDMVLLGPGIGFYKISAKINEDLNVTDKQIFYGRLNDFLKDKIPGYNKIINGDGFAQKGSENTTAFGYRYMVNLGYRF